MFDSRKYLESIEAPTFIAPNGRVFKGRVLSADEFAPLQVAIRECKSADGAIDWPRMRKVMYAIIEQIFPRPRWKFWERSALSWIRTLPELGQMQAVWDFTRSQGKASGIEIHPISPGTAPANELREVVSQMAG